MNLRRRVGAVLSRGRRLRQRALSAANLAGRFALRTKSAIMLRAGAPRRAYIARRRRMSVATDLSGVTPFALCLHLYHLDQWPSFRRRFLKVSGQFDLFVTTSCDRFDDACRLVHPDFPSAFILACPNRGRDVAPFIRLLRSGRIDRYDVILKLHSKSSPHLKRGGSWREELLDALIGDAGIVDASLAAFAKNPRLGLLGPQGHRLDAPWSWGRNRSAYETLMARMKIDALSARLDFFQGTMFWVRRAALKRVEALDLRTRDFEPESGQLDGTLAHTLERAIPAAVRAEGMALADTREMGAPLIPPHFRGGLVERASPAGSEEADLRAPSFGMLPRTPRMRDLRTVNEALGKNRPTVEAIILSHDGAHHLEALFASVREHVRYENFRLTIVDHASTDDTESLCARWSEHLALRRIAAPDNFSFAGSNNRVAGVSDADILFFLNNDVRLESDILARAVAMLDHGDAGVVGFKSFDAAGRPEHIGVRFRELDRRTFFRRPVNVTGDAAYDEILAKNVVAVDSVSFCAAFVRRDEFLDLGGFHEGYVYGYEDVDFCLKYRRAHDKSVLCVNDAGVRHDVGRTRRLMPEDRNRVRHIANMQLLAERFGAALRREERRRLADDDHERRLTPPIVGIISHQRAADADADALASEFHERGWRVVSEKRRPELEGASWNVICHIRPEQAIRIKGRQGAALETASAAAPAPDPPIARWFAGFDAVNHEGAVNHAGEDTSSSHQDGVQACAPPGERAGRLLASARRAEDDGLRIVLKVPNDVRCKSHEQNWDHRAQNLADALRVRGHRVRIEGVRHFARTPRFEDDAVIVFRGSEPYHPYVDQIAICWLWGDDAVAVDELRHFDRVFAASLSCVERLRKEGVAAEFMGPWLGGASRDGVQPESVPPNLKDRALIVECGGAARRAARRARIPHMVYGGAFRHDPTADGGFLSLSQRRHYDAAAQLVVVDHAGADIAKGHIGTRAFEAVAAGAVVAAQAHPELERLLGDAVLIWRTPQDLKRLFEQAADMDFRAKLLEKAEERLRALGAEKPGDVFDRAVREHHDARLKGALDAPIEARPGEVPSFDGLTGSADDFGLPKTTQLRAHQYLMRRYRLRGGA